MASANARSGELFFDFRYRGVRCREYSKLPDTPANRKRMQKVLDHIEQAMATGAFDYATFFPGSRLAAQFAPQAAPGTNATAAVATSVGATDGVQPATSATPSFHTFIEEWFTTSLPAWRQSHAATVRSTLDCHLIPWFGELPVGAITKADVLRFRADIAHRKGRGGNATLSAKTINRVVQLLRQALAEAGEQYGLTNPVERVKRLKQHRVDIHRFSLGEARQLIATIREDYRP